MEESSPQSLLRLLRVGGDEETRSLKFFPRAPTDRSQRCPRGGEAAKDRSTTRQRLALDQDRNWPRPGVEALES